MKSQLWASTCFSLSVAFLRKQNKGKEISPKTGLVYVLTADRIDICVWKVVKFSYHLFNIIAYYSSSRSKDALRLDRFHISLLQCLLSVNKEVGGGFVLYGSLVTTEWHILTMITQEAACWDAGQLWMYPIITNLQPKGGSHPTLGLGWRLITLTDNVESYSWYTRQYAWIFHCVLPYLRFRWKFWNFVNISINISRSKMAVFIFGIKRHFLTALTYKKPNVCGSWFAVRLQKGTGASLQPEML